MLKRIGTRTIDGNCYAMRFRDGTWEETPQTSKLKRKFPNILSTISFDSLQIAHIGSTWFMNECSLFLISSLPNKSFHRNIWFWYGASIFQTLPYWFLTPSKSQRFQTRFSSQLELVSFFIIRSAIILGPLSLPISWVQMWSRIALAPTGICWS